MTALAVVLALGACSTVEDSWDYVFGGDGAPAVEDAAATDDLPRGLRGDGAGAGDYAETTRRQPTSTHALDETPRRAVAETAAPAVAPQSAPQSAPVSSGRVERVDLAEAPAIAQADPAPPQPMVPVVPLIPDTAGGEVMANAPVPVSSTPPRLRAPTGEDDRLLVTPPLGRELAAPPLGVAGGFGGGLDELGTTVIGGDGRVISQPSAPPAYAHGGASYQGLEVRGDAGPGFLDLGQGSPVATIQFRHGSAALSAEDRRVLREVVDIQRRHGGMLRVVGHASSRTANMPMDRHRMVNYTTSVQRGAAVADELRRQGVPDGAVETVALADNQPLYREVMPVGEAGNRRAEIYLIQ